MKAPPDPHCRHRFPVEVICHAVWLYHVFSLSLRDVELLLADSCIPAFRTRHEKELACHKGDSGRIMGSLLMADPCEFAEAIPHSGPPDEFVLWQHRVGGCDGHQAAVFIRRGSAGSRWSAGARSSRQAA